MDTKNIVEEETKFAVAAWKIALSANALHTNINSVAQTIRESKVKLDQQTKDVTNIINVDKIHLMTLDYNKHKFKSMRRIMRFAMIATVFTSIILFLGIHQKIHMSLCVTLCLAWWAVLFVIIIGAIRQYRIRDKHDWNKFAWNTVLNDETPS